MNDQEVVPTDQLQHWDNPEVESSLTGFMNDVLKYDDVVTEETTTVTTLEGIAAAAKALAEIYSRSFSGRHPELGRMINCQFCNMRHRENERKCVQKFTTVVNRGPEEKTVPERTAPQTKRGVLGSKAFAKRRIRPHSNRWLSARTNSAAAKKREKDDLDS